VARLSGHPAHGRPANRSRLLKRSLTLGPIAQDEVGTHLVRALCEAIAGAALVWRAVDEDVFAYRGQDLGYAVERDTFMRLVNNRDLYAAVRALRNNETVPDVVVANRFENAVAEALLGREAMSQVYLTDRSLPRALVQWFRAGARGFRRGSPPHTGDLPRDAVCVVVKHPKFFDFIEPVARRLEGRMFGLSTSAETSLHLSMRRFPFAIPSATSRRAPMGRGLRDLTHIADEFDAFVEVLAATRPIAVVVLEGNAGTDEVVNRAAATLGIPCICVQHGWAPIINTGFRNMSYSAMAVWGRGFADLLQPHNPGQRFAVTGSPAFDDAHRYAKTELAARIGNRHAVLFSLQATAPTISQENVESLIRLARRAATWPEAAVLVREHPSHPLQSQSHSPFDDESVITVPPSRYPLLSVLECSEVVVSISSTTLLEGIALGKPAVVFSQTSGDRYSPDIEAWGAGVEVRDEADALLAVQRLFRDASYREAFRPGMRHFRDEFFAGADGRAADRIADLVGSVTRR
jgi:hypothetical protein